MKNHMCFRFSTSLESKKSVSIKSCDRLDDDTEDGVTATATQSETMQLDDCAGSMPAAVSRCAHAVVSFAYACIKRVFLQK
jgi:hypothetical protein